MTGIQTAGAMNASVGGITAGYDLFENKEEFDVDFLIMGSANYHNMKHKQLLTNLYQLLN